MPQGLPKLIPNDGLTTKTRRNKPLLAIHTGFGKGKSTAAFGMALRAWNQGFSIVVFQFIKSAKWKSGEEKVFIKLDDLHHISGNGSSIEWYKMGAGWSWLRKNNLVNYSKNAFEGWIEIRNRLANERNNFYILDEFTYPLNWGWVDIQEVIEVLTKRPGNQHIIITGRNTPQGLIDVADLVTDMTKIKHPMDIGCKGQKGIEW